MKELKIDWLNCCENCNSHDHMVKTKDGTSACLYDGDEVICNNCGHTGEVEADGQCAWVNWDEINEN